MLFNTFQFAIFFGIVYSLYLSLSHKWQNRMLLAASYVFYGAWDWRFLSLIVISTVLDYLCGIKIHESEEPKRRKLFLFLSVFGNLSILGFFKYCNFFAANFQILLTSFGIPVQPRLLHIILPVGISFYTFQTMSYTIDIYRREMQPTRRFFDFALFVAFFPQLVAGPIERAKHLLPQILSPRTVRLETFYEGCYLIFWGLFQKVLVADNLARIVDPVFASSPPYNGVAVLLALYAFAFQIFCDFAGYSNIARGLGKTMGFDIMVNFNLPYTATNPRAFWQRWHISLSSWLRDYLYISLGGNRKGTLVTYRNLIITMLLGGLWHGAAWTFVFWGAYHGILLILHRLLTPLLDRIPAPRNEAAVKAWSVVKVLFFFQVICFGWLLFRAQSMTQVLAMLQGLIGNLTFSSGAVSKVAISYTAMLVGMLLAVQWVQFSKKNLMAMFHSPAAVRVFFYVVCYYLIIIYGVTSGTEFIYFQF